MTMAPALQRWLHDRHLAYDLIEHRPTRSALSTALICGIPGDRMAKAVVLRDGGDYVLAILPASSRIELAELSAQFGRRPHLATEPEVERLFSDCASGAVPPAGDCYGLEAIVDTSIDRQPEIFFEAGDHATVVHMSGEAFAQLTDRAQHCAFSASYDDSPRWRE